MKYLTFVLGLVLGVSVFAGGSAAMASLVPIHTEGKRTLTAENAEGKFLVVAGVPDKVDTREDLLNYWYVRTHDLLSKVASIPVSSCEDPFKDQIESISNEVAEIQSAVSQIQ